MQRGTHDFGWKHLGALLANSDDQDQTDFLKAFLKECKSWGTHMQIESQLAGVNAKLTSEERQMLAMLSYDEN